jgi:hypothetical protein
LPEIPRIFRIESWSASEYFGKVLSQKKITYDEEGPSRDERRGHPHGAQEHPREGRDPRDDQRAPHKRHKTLRKRQPRKSAKSAQKQRRLKRHERKLLRNSPGTQQEELECL